MRSYEQLCALSKSLDVVGGRWTLLLVRELLLGPRRFTDLRSALPGIATNLLAERLRELEAEGVLTRRRLAGPGEVHVYELTERGQALEEVVLALIRWGADFMAPSPREHFRPEWLALVLRAYLPGRVPRQDSVHARLLAGDAAIDVDARPNGVRVVTTASRDEQPSITVDADPHALLAVGSGAERFAAARRRGALVVHGPREQAARLERVFDAISPR